MRPPRLVLQAFAFVAAGSLFTGCDKASDPARAPTPRGLPPINADELTPTANRAHAEHPRTDTDTEAHGGAMPPGHPAVAGEDDPHASQHGANPHAANSHEGADPQGSMQALSPGDIEFDKKTVIAGSLVLDAKVKDKVKTGDVIYLVVRGVTDGATPGAVLAVKRLQATSFPMPFQLDSRDAMVVGTQLKPPVVLNVRVDKEGDAMTKNPGDVTGTTTVKSLPSEKLKLNLDTLL